MKKITLLLLMSLFCISGYSQLALEGFETTTGPDALPSTNWTLGTGNWAVFDNGVGTGQRWGINTTNVCVGTQIAYMNREFIGQNNTSEDYLATPLVLIPTNGELHFQTRTFTNNNQGTLFQIKVAPATASQTNPAAYTLVQQWDETTLTAVYNVCEEKIVDLSAYAGQQIYVSFVQVFTQPTTSLGGDRWLVDNASINVRCLVPTGLTATGITFNGANLNWANPSGATSWEIEVVPALSTPTGVGTVYSGPLPYPVTGLSPNTTYKYYVRALCSTGYTSVWSAVSNNFTTSVAPPICGGNFIDSGGIAGNYGNNANLTTTITPTTGNVVTVTFTAFNTQAGLDILNVYNGPTAASPLIASFSGTNIPGSITSSSAEGSLTFVFISNATTTAAGWQSNVTCAPPPTCPEPITLVTSNVTPTSATFGWTNVGPATAWQVLALPCGSPAPTSTSTGWIDAPTNPYNFTGLTSASCYNLYVRGVCSPTDSSEWGGPIVLNTPVAPPVCGGNFVDSGGPTGNYGNNENITTTICPVTAGEQVTVTFTSFNVEACCDDLNIYDGNSATAPLLGNFQGTAIPPSFTSSATNGCLTFVFTSDGSVTPGGWITNITCAPAPVCPKPTVLTTTALLSTSVSFGWTNNGPGTSWQVLALPCGSPAPTAATIGWTAAPTNPFLITGLTPSTCYDLYVRADCDSSSNGVSLWAGPRTVTTQNAPPVCGGLFVDSGGSTGNYGNNENITTTICATNPGDIVTVTFTAFNVENCCDDLNIYDGDSATAPLLGNFQGTAIPPSFTSSATNGCLTFVFTSDGSVTPGGWIANVTCAPAPNCARPTALTATSITSTSALLGWTEPTAGVTQWEVLVVPFGSPVPLPTATGTIVSINPALFTGLTPATQYTFYVRSLCPTTGTSLWSIGANFTTLIINDECTGAIFTPVNSSAVCQQIASGTITGATASTPGTTAPCVGSANDDVWFQFIASNPYLNVSLQNIVGSTTNLNYGVYSGACGTLTQIFCSPANTTTAVVNNLTVGLTYFIRVYSNSAAVQTATFDLCITTPSSCISGQTVCSLTNYVNTVGVIPGLGQIGCLGSSPNPTFFTVQVATTGPINFLLTQSSVIGGAPDRDVDYAAWGPFTSQAAGCAAIGNPPTLAPGIGVPVTQQTGCSFSAAPTENLNIANATAGQYYIILITNFSNQPGFINLTQTNASAPGAGATNCCPDAFFSYVPSTFCLSPGATNPTPIIAQNSVAGTFSLSPASPTGLVFANTATGEINLAASTPGNYVILNTVAPTLSCIEPKERSYTVSLVAPAVATISYEFPSYCRNILTAPVTQTGVTGGTYAVSPNGGLSINTNTGDINPSLSAPGIYTITYSLPGSTVCVNSNPQTVVEIVASPNIAQPAPVVACDTYTLPALTVGDYYSQSQVGGPATVPLDISIPIIATQTFYIYAINANGCYTERSFTVTINSVPTPIDVTTTASSCNSPTGTATVNFPFTPPDPLPTDLFISEVTDANTGSLTYIEIYNGTGSAINLANYKLKVYTFGNVPVNPATLSCNLDLSGTIANNATCIIKVSANANQAGIVPNLTFTACGGVNNNDHIKLTSSTDVEIDLWGRTDGTVYTPNNQTGYTYRRNNTANFPSLTWDPSDWTAFDPEDYTNVGSYALPASNYQYSIDNGAFQVPNTFTGIAGGPHVVTVKDITTNCTASINITIDVIGASTLDSLTATTPICSGENAVFTLTGTPNATVTYTINNGVSQTIVLDPAGNATVTEIAVTADTTILLTQISLTGCTVPISNTATVVVPANPTVTNLSVTTPVCSGGNAVFTLTGTPNATVTYTINNGANQTVVLDATGTGTVTENAVTADTTILLSQISLGLCNSTITDTATVVVTPNPTFGNLTATTPVCSSGDAVFTLTGTANATVTYTINNGVNQTVVLDAIGNATVTEIAVTADTTILLSQISLAGCNTALTNTATVVVSPNPTFGSLTANTPICSGANAVFSMTGTANATVTYTINNGANQTVVLSASGNGTVTINAVADTTILLSQISLAGCNTAINNTATVVVSPNPTFGNLTVTTPVCSGGDAVYTLSGTANGTVTYTINNGASQTVVLDGTGNATVTINAVTTDTTILLSQINSGSCNTTLSNTATVTVNALPQVTILGGCQGTDYVLLASPIADSFDPTTATYSWEDSSGNPIGGNTQSIIVTDEGDYTVNVVSGGCSGFAMFTAADIGCVIQKGISVNSTPDGLNDCLDLVSYNVKKLSIFNRYGMKVYSLDGYTNQWCGQSDNGDELPDGTYYYVIERNNGETKTGWIYLNKEI